MQKFINEFPILNQYTYVNTPQSGLLYESLLEWRQEHDLDYLIGGSMKKIEHAKIIPETKKNLSRFFNCKVDNLALVSNFSLGINMLLEGLDSNKTVLLLEGDYPSVNWPYEDRGFDVHYAKIDHALEHNIKLALTQKKTDILALSLVQWVNGIKVDLEFLKEIKQNHPELIIIADGTQYFGSCAFDFEASAIDIAGASAYKWLLAGYGNGFMLLKEHVKKHFKLQTIGFNAADRNDANRKEIAFNRRLEPGHLDTLNFGSLNFSLNFLSRIGMDNIETKNNILSHKAKTAFTALGLLEESVVQRAAHSTIFNVKGDNAMYQKLLDADVICAQRGTGIRFGFHFYNTEKDIDRIVDILK